MNAKAKVVPPVMQKTFVPSFTVDISSTLKNKIAIMKEYERGRSAIEQSIIA